MNLILYLQAFVSAPKLSCIPLDSHHVDTNKLFPQGLATTPNGWQWLTKPCATVSAITKQARTLPSQALFGETSKNTSRETSSK